MNVFSVVPLLLLSSFAFAVDWQQAAAPMLTSWGKELKPGQAWQEHPRPQLRREGWRNLNGLWERAVTKAGAPLPTAWDGTILVPFALEAPLSGVGRLLQPDEDLWYRRSFSAKSGERLRLHFEAVDYEATVWLNGKELGRHRGGSTPFSFDLAGVLKDGDNELVVKVHDETEGHQLHGKQCLDPRGIWCSRVSGIWQTVWLEAVPERHVAGLSTEMADGGSRMVDGKAGESATGVSQLLITPDLGGKAVAGERVRVTVSFDGKEVATGSGVGKLAIDIPEAKRWTPETPHLYDLKVELLDGGGQVLDTVSSYAALRTIGKARDARGNLRLTLNGKPYFLYGTLDQGWWPDGLLTPPSDAAMVSDLKYLKDAGFNLIRKHVKVEPARYYWHCDRLGLAVWQDHVSASLGSYSEAAGIAPRWTRMQPNPADATWPDEAHRQWVTEYQRMVDHLRDHPSVFIWGTFNEAWGQHRSMEIGRMAMDYDPSRLLCHASGGNFWPVGDIASEHHYPEPSFPFRDARFRDYVKVCGEMGGHGWAIPGHVHSPDKARGYGAMAQSADEWKTRYTESIRQLAFLRQQGISAAVYTQTSDMWNEVNGLLTYDRLPKVDASWLRETNAKLMSLPEPAGRR